MLLCERKKNQRTFEKEACEFHIRYTSKDPSEAQFSRLRTPVTSEWTRPIGRIFSIRETAPATAREDRSGAFIARCINYAVHGNSSRGGQALSWK